MDIQFLRTFLEVARTRHFGKTAENLFLTQSAISARIRFLEETIGEPLFIRQRNNIQLSATGEKLIPYAEGIVNLWNRAKQEVVLAEDTDNVLSVSCTPGLWELFLHHWLIQLAKSPLSVSISTTVYKNVELFQKVREFSIDLVFTFEPPVDEGIKVKPVATIPILLVTTECNQSIDDAISKQYIFVDWGTAINMEITNHYGENLRPLYKISHNHLALSLLLQHQGAAYLAEQSVREHIASSNLYLVPEAPRFDRTIYAAYSDKSHHAALITQSLKLFDQFTSVAEPDMERYQSSS